MVLSLLGWFNGITASIKLIFDFIVGGYLLYKAKKLNAKPLFYVGFIFLFPALYFSGTILDFLTVIFTGSNMSNPELHGPLTYFWFAFGGYFVIMLGSELIIPKKKKILSIIFFILGTCYILVLIGGVYFRFEFFLVLNPMTGENLIHSALKPDTLLFFLLAFIISVSILVGFGFIFKARQSTGVIRKKYYLISITFILYCAGITLESFIVNESMMVILFFTRACIFTSAFCLYFGIKEVTEEPKKERLKKTVEVEDGLFRVIKRPDNITEEEITYHRERKICLVCKGNVSRISYICPNCETLYCIKCSESLTNLENACWVCNAPFDPSKPVKPFTTEKTEELRLEEDTSKEFASDKKI